MGKLLQTKRLFLRNLRRSDEAVLYGYRNDPRCYVYQRWEDTSHAFLRQWLGQYERSRFLSEEEEQHYAVCASDGKLVGDLSYFYTEEDQCVTLGITIAPEHQRRGYAFDLLTALVAAVQAAHPQLDIVALIDKENAPSIGLFEKLGFFRECYAESIASYVYVIAGKRQAG